MLQPISFLPAQAPALFRALVDSTQPSDSVVSKETQQLVQGYLEDRRCVDTVYSTLLQRALVSDSNESIVDKCIALLKKYIERYIPSRPTLKSLAEFCVKILNDNSSKSGRKAAVSYLLHKAEIALGSDYPSTDTPPRERMVLSPLRTSTADELMLATAHLDSQGQPLEVPYSVACILQQGHHHTTLPQSHLATALQGYLSGQAPAEQGGSSSSTLSSNYIISSIMEGTTEQVAAQVHDIVTATMTRQASSWPGLGQEPTGPEIGPRLYSPPFYTTQDPLVMDEAEVGGVVGLICSGSPVEGQATGVPLPRSWGQDEGLWKSTMGQASLGQMCANILVKLLLDMWLRNPPEASSILAARMLRTALDSPRPDIRCRAFDLLYNLSMHSALLGELTQPEVTQHLWGLEEWLRGLLYQAVHHLQQAEESVAEVWHAALGVLLQLTTQCGHLSAPLAADVPPSVAAAFLDRCLQYCWSEELYCHLVELAAFTLLPPQALVPQALPEEGDAAEWTLAVTEEGAVQLQQLLDDFGGLPYLLSLFCSCPTPSSQMLLLRVMLHAVAPVGTPPGQMAHVASILVSPTATHALHTALRLPVPGLAAHVQSCLTRATAAAAVAGPDGDEQNSDLDSALLLQQVLSSLEAAALSTAESPEAAAVEAALQKLPASTTDPLAAWKLLKGMRPPVLPHPAARKVAVLRLYRLVDASIAQHQVNSLPQLAAVGLLPQPPSASAVLQGAAVPQSLLADLLAAGPHGAAAAVLLVQRLLAALRHRVLAAARGRDAAAATLRWHLGAASAATWRTLLQWLQESPGGVPRELLRTVAQEVVQLPALTGAQGTEQHADANDGLSGGSSWELPAAGVVVSGKAALLVKSLQLMGPILVPLLQLLTEGPAAFLDPDRGCHIRLHRPLTAGRHPLPPALWAPWTDTDSDNRLAVVLLLVGIWQLQPAELAGAAAQQVVRSWLEDADARVRYVGGRCLQLQLLATQPEQYWSSLRVLVLQAQRLVQFQLVDNPLLQMSALQEMKLV